MKKYFEKNHKPLGFAGSFIALVIAAVYAVLIPQEAATANGIQWLILVYGHSLCWLLLSAASLLWAVNVTNRWSAKLAYAALAVYAVFMGTLLIS